jgi:hypothetical protein
VEAENKVKEENLMTKTVLYFVALVSLAAVSPAMAANLPKEEREVLAAMDVYKNAMIGKDGAALDKLLSPDLAYVHSGGEFQSKADVIDSIAKAKTVIEKIEYSDTTVRFYGNTALVRGRVDLWHSKDNIVHMNVLHVWVRGPQGWQMVSRQATKLAK